MLLCNHGNHRCAFALAVEMRLHFRRELYGAVFAGEKRVVVRAKDVSARRILRAALTDDDLADGDLLAVLKLDPKPFGYGIAP